MLPDTKGTDYRVHVAGTLGFADLDHGSKDLRLTNPKGDAQPIEKLPPDVLVVEQWLDGGDLVTQEESLRANRISVRATEAAVEGRRIPIE